MPTRYIQGGGHTWCSSQGLCLVHNLGTSQPIPVGLLRGTVSQVHWSREFEKGAYLCLLVEGNPIRSNIEEYLWFGVVEVVCFPT